MKNNIVSEVVISLVLLVLVALLLNPFGLWMPSSLHMMVMAAMVVMFVIFAGFVWRERSADEREGLHKMMAGHIAFLVGTGTLVLGVVVQSLRHELDYWLVIALAVMLLAKIIGHIYTKMRY